MKTLLAFVIDPVGGFTGPTFIPAEPSARLNAMQGIVGGLIERVPIDPASGVAAPLGLDMYVNEEGRLLGLPELENPFFSDSLAGPILFVRSDDEGETIALKPDDIAWIIAQGSNEWWNRVKGV